MIIGMQESPMRKERYGYGSVLIEGTKTMRGRGWDYDYVIIHKDKRMSFGSEEGNYAGGIWLTPQHAEYEERQERQLQYYYEHDKEFYDLIMKELDEKQKELLDSLKQGRLQTNKEAEE